MDPMSLVTALVAAFAIGLFVAVLVVESRRKGAVHSLRGSEDRLKKLFRNSPAAIGLVRLRDGVVLDVNEAYERLFGWRREEAIGRSTEELRIWVDPGERARFRELIAASGRVVDFASRARRRGGEEFDSLLSSEIIEEDGERIVLVIATDVSAHRRAEEALRELNEKLESMVAARTAALDAANRELEAFSYSVSHDLRAPLRAIEGFSRLLEERHAAALDAEARGYVQRVRAAARRMNQLIDDLLEFSRVGRVELRRRRVDLSALAAAVAREITAGTPERRVEWRIEAGLSADADEGLMRVVLENLLGNAWKYTGRTAQAVIEFGRCGAREFRVRDNGVGYDPAHADGLFQPFRRLHGEQEFEGSGVGLATVKRIIDRHGGSVRAEGAVGGGAAFYFALPGAG